MNILEGWSKKPSRIFRVCAFGFCVGIGLGQWSRLLDVWLILFVCSFLLCLFFARFKSFWLLMLGTCFFAFGGWRSSLTLWSPSGLPFETSVQLVGTIEGEVELHPDFQEITLSKAFVDGQGTNSNILVDAGPYPLLSSGQTISFGCSLSQPEPIQGFRYDLYLASRGVWATCFQPSLISIQPQPPLSISNDLFRLKAFLMRRLTEVLPQADAAFFSGLMFGGAWALPSNLQTAFSLTGMSHILAADGTKVSLITLIFLGWAAQTFGRRRAIVLALVLLFAYVIMAGAVPSAVRAGLMASTLLVGMWKQRRADAANLLLLAAGVMLMGNPKILLADPGFQLSVSATAGLMFFVPTFEAVFHFLPTRFGLREAFVASLAASLVTMPISLWHFGSLSLIGPLANFMLLPFVPFLAAVGVLTCFASMFSALLGTIIAWPAHLAASLFLFVVQALAQVPIASFAPSAPFAHLWAIISLIPIFALMWWCRVRGKTLAKSSSA